MFFIQEVVYAVQLLGCQFFPRKGIQNFLFIKDVLFTFCEFQKF